MNFTPSVHWHLPMPCAACFLQRTLILFALASFSSSGLTTATFATEKPPVVAYVGEQPITYAEVDFQLGRRVPLDPSVQLPPLSPAILQSTVYLIGQQRQALQTLRVQKQGVKREEVERWIADNLQPKMPDNSSEKPPVADFIREQADAAGISETAFREHISFRLAWQQYLRQHLTDKNVAKHFQNHKTRFDGTQFQIASIAIAVPAGESKQRTSASSYLLALHARLKSGETNWATLLTELDAAILDADKLDLPSGISAEQIVIREQRWIRGTGDEHPAVVIGLARLSSSEFSSVIETPTAVQVVQLLEIKPGDRELAEARDEVRADMLLYLLEHLASQSRKQLPLRAAP